MTSFRGSPAIRVGVFARRAPLTDAQLATLASVAGKLDKSGGVMSGIIDMGGHRIEGVTDPDSDDDATNFGFVKSLIDEIRTHRWTRTAALDMGGNRLEGLGSPDSGDDAVNLAYLLAGSIVRQAVINMGGYRIENLAVPDSDDDAVPLGTAKQLIAQLGSTLTTALAGKLDKAGGSMTGILNMGGSRIEGVGAPDSDDDVVNRGWTSAAITAAINALVDAAPGTLNTLKELADALGDDPNFATTVTNLIAATQAALVQEAQGRAAAVASAANRGTAWSAARYAPSGNLYDDHAAYVGTGLNGSLGQMFAASGFFTTGFIPVREAQPILCNVALYNYAFYGLYDELLSGVSISVGGTPLAPDTPIVPPAGTFFFQASAPSAALKTLVVTADAALPQVNKPFGWTGSRWHGRGIACAGDSIELATGAAWAPSYPPLVAEWLQASLVHFTGDAVSGRTMDSLVPYLTSGALAPVDLLHVKIGTDDHSAGVPLGTMADARNLTGTGTFYGATAAVIQAAQTVAVGQGRDIGLAFSTPMKKGRYDLDPYHLLAWDDTNTVGLTLEPYADAIVEVCGYYSIPVLDLFRCSGFNQFTYGSLTQADKLHPSLGIGVPRLARQIAGFLAGV